MIQVTPGNGRLGGEKARILAVDDSPAFLRLLTRLLQQQGHTVTSTIDSARAVEEVHAQSPDLVLLDVMMPEPDGVAVCRALKGHPATRLTPVVMITATDATADRLRAIEAGADDFLTKPIDTAELEARVRSLVRLKRYTDDLESAESVILSLALTVEARDAYTDGHCHRLATYATALGRRSGLDDRALSTLRRGGYLHDVGKIGVPDAVLLKKGLLTADEYRVMQQHTIIGERLCGDLRSLVDVRPIIRHHHERLDGSGYPDGLAGDAVPLLAQIMSVVDVYDALTTDRPYRPAMQKDEALAVLRDEVRLGWRRADFVDALAALVERGEMCRETSVAVAE